MSSTERKEPEPAASVQQAVTELQDDDEFCDFPEDDWDDKNTLAQKESVHLWEESWDDDDHDDAFTSRLREELSKK